MAQGRQFGQRGQGAGSGQHYLTAGIPVNRFGYPGILYSAPPGTPNYGYGYHNLTNGWGYPGTTFGGDLYGPTYGYYGPTYGYTRPGYGWGYGNYGPYFGRGQGY